MRKPERRHLGRARQVVIGEGGGERLAELVERRLLEQRRADALRRAAIDLARDHHRVDHGAAILHHHVVEHLDRPGVGIDRDDRRMGRVGKRAVIRLRAVADHRLDAVGVDVGRELLRVDVPDPADLRERQVAARSHHPPVGDADLVRLALQQVGADGPHPLHQHLAGARHRAARHDDAARGVGAGRIRREAGIAVDDRDVLRVDAQDLARHLGEGGFHPLAVRLHADPELQPAVRRQFGAGLLVARHHLHAPAREHRGPVRGLLDIAAEAEPDQPAVRLVPGLALAHRGDVDHLRGPGDGPGMIARIERLPGDVGVGHGRGRDHVDHPDLVRLAPDRARHRVDQHLHREGDAGPRHAAIGNQRGLVGDHRPGLHAIGLDRVRPRQVAAGHRRFQAVGEGVDRIGPGIDGHLAFEAEDPAVCIGVRGDDVVVLAAVGVGDQMLAPVGDPARRAAELHRVPAGDELLRLDIGLEPEPAADVGGDDADLALLQPEEEGKAGADQMRHLGRGVDDQLVHPRIPFGQDRAPLHRHHRLAAHAELAGHGMRRARLDRLHVAVGAGGQRDVVAPRLVDQRGARLARFQHVDRRRKLLVIDLDRLREIFRLGAGLSDARRDRLADEAHLADGERREIGRLVSRQFRRRAHRCHAVEVVGGEHPVLRAFGLDDRANAAVRHRAPDEGERDLVGGGDVGDVVAAPREEPPVFLAQHARADSGVAHRCFPSWRCRMIHAGRRPVNAARPRLVAAPPICL